MVFCTCNAHRRREWPSYGFANSSRRREGAVDEVVTDILLATERRCRDRAVLFSGKIRVYRIKIKKLRTPAEFWVRTTEFLNPFDILFALNISIEPHVLFSLQENATHARRGVTGSANSVNACPMKLKEESNLRYSQSEGWGDLYCRQMGLGSDPSGI